MIPLKVRRASKEYEDNNPNATLHEAFLSGYLFFNGDTLPAPIIINDADNETEVPMQLSDDELFDIAWNLYDRKDNKMSAKKAWKRLSKDDKEKVLACIPAYVKAHDEKKYRPMFATFLNQERYNDEEYVIANNTQQSNAKGDDSDFISSSLLGILKEHS